MSSRGGSAIRAGHVGGATLATAVNPGISHDLSLLPTVAQSRLQGDVIAHSRHAGNARNAFYAAHASAREEIARAHNIPLHAVTEAMIIGNPTVHTAQVAMERARALYEDALAAYLPYSIHPTFPRSVTAADVRQMVGAHSEDRVVAEPYGSHGLELKKTGADGGTAHFIISGDGNYDVRRQLGIPMGALVMYVPYVQSGAKSFDSGTALLSGFRALRDAGIQAITATAARTSGRNGQTKLNGYYTWARMGATGKLTPAVQRKFLADTGQHATRVEQVVSTRSGLNWWKQNGKQFEATLDLRPGGRTFEILSEMESRLATRGGK